MKPLTLLGLATVSAGLIAGWLWVCWRCGWRVYWVEEAQLYREPFHTSSAGEPAKVEDDSVHCLRGL